MGQRRDYVPSREKNLTERMDQGSSLSDGLAGRVTAQKDGAHYRTYRDANGQEDRGKKYRGTNDDNDWGVM